MYVLHRKLILVPKKGVILHDKMCASLMCCSEPVCVLFNLMVLFKGETIQLYTFIEYKY